MATRTFRGDAVAVAQVTTISVDDTWATGDTAVLTINGKDLTLTVGTTSTTAQIALDIIDMVNGDDANGDETRSTTGNLIPEFDEITASNVTASTVTLTADTKGVPFTITASETTAGDGTLGTPTNSTAATGPNHYDDADNWSDSTLPVDADDVVVDAGDTDILYGLDQNAVTPASFKVMQRYSGNIGLPYENANGYTEYRDRYLKVGNSGDATNITVTIGLGSGNGSGRMNIDFGTGQYTATIFNTGNSRVTGTTALQLLGSHATNTVTIHGGDVGMAINGGETANIDTITMHGGALRCGAGVTVEDISVYAGTFKADGCTTTGSKTLTIL